MATGVAAFLDALSPDMRGAVRRMGWSPLLSGHFTEGNSPMHAAELWSRFEEGESDFCGADLQGADLAQADLPGADLRGRSW